MSRRVRILFLINSLSAGGAERQLSTLVRHMDRTQFDLHVAVFYEPGYRNPGELWAEVAAAPGVTLHTLHKPAGMVGYLRTLARLLALTLRIRPDLLHGYMQGNLPVLLVGRLLRKPVVWGIRRASMDLAKLDRKTLRYLKLMLRLSPFADLVIFNSEAGARHYQAMGLRPRRLQVISNGFDVDHFVPDRGRGAAQRRAWGVPPDAPLVGIAGRLDPVKDHPTFLRMAARLVRDWPEARFVCVGQGPPAYLASLQELAREMGVGDRVLWPGLCLDMPGAYNALTVLVLSSTDEGFPNVLGEAMACGIPCVTTPAGDAGRLVGEAGTVCGFGDDAALAATVSRLLGASEETRAGLAAACRNRIVARFSLEALIRDTEQALLGLLGLEAPLRGASGRD